MSNTNFAEIFDLTRDLTIFKDEEYLKKCYANIIKHWVIKGLGSFTFMEKNISELYLYRDGKFQIFSS